MGWDRAGFLRPKASLSYSHVTGGGYDLSGDVLGFQVTVGQAGQDFDYGVLETSAEVSRLFALSDQRQMLAFSELGVTYEFERPNGGEILTGDLSFATPSAWSGTLRTGVRMQLAPTTLLEGSIGYLSIGQDGLDVWEGKLHLAYGF